MPHLTKSLFYVIVIFQILLNITCINSAVIRREQRSITTNGTSFGISDKELDPATAIGLENDGNLLLDTLSVTVKNDDGTTTENSVQDALVTTTIVGEDKNKEDTTLTGLRLDENTVGLSTDTQQESSKAPIEDGFKNKSEKSKNEDSTTTEIEDKSTSIKISETTTNKIPETTTILANIENDTTTSKNDDSITIEIETSTNLKAKSIDKANNEEKLDSTVKNLEDDTTVLSTLLEKTTDSDPINTTVVPNLTTSTEKATTISVETDSTIKTTESVTNFKLEEVDKVTEPLQVQNELVDTSTELSVNDIPKTFATKKNTENLIEDVTSTESILLIKDQSTIKLPVDTTQLPTSTEISDQHDIKTIIPDFKRSTTNETKTSNSTSTEKRGKYIAHNYSSLNEFNLPNTSDVWALAGLRTVGKAKSSELQNSVETSEEKPANTSMGTKSLHDWTRVMETTHEMESKLIPKIVETAEESTTEVVSLTSATTNAAESKTTVKLIEVATEITTEKPDIELETTESRMSLENEVELPTTKIEAEPTTIKSISSTTKIEEEPTTVKSISSTTKIEEETVPNPTESQQTTNNDLETSTVNYENADKTTIDDNPPKDTDSTIPPTTTTTVSSLKPLTIHEKIIEENKVDGDSFEKETISLQPTTTTTNLTSIPELMTVKSETTVDSHVNNGEITQEVANAGTTSLPTTSLSDFTTSIPFLTSTVAITKETMVIMTDVTTTTAPPVTFNMDYEENATKMPSQTTSPAPVTIELSSSTILPQTTPTTTTTTTTTIPAVTVMAATTETQTTTTEAPPSHTPSIINNNNDNNETMMIQKTNNNYNEYEVVNKSTENYAENSSTEAFEATTRVGSQPLSTNNAAEEDIISTTEVDKLDDTLEITTVIVTDFEDNNAYDIETTTVNSTVSTVAPNKTYSIETVTVSNAASNAAAVKTSTTENLDHIDPIHKNSDNAETSIESNVIDPLQVGGETSTTATTTTTTTEESNNQENMKMHSSTERGNDGDGVDSIFSITTKLLTTTTTTSTTTPNYDESATTLESISTKKEDVYSIVPTIDNGSGGGFHVPKLVLDDTTTLMPPGEIGIGNGLQPMDSPEAQETDVNVIIAISVSTVGIIALILLVAFLYVMRKRQKQMSYGQRCRPVSLDAYSLDNVSVYNSVRRKGATLRASKRSYGNVAFDDPSLRHNVLGTHELARYVEKKSSIWEEFKEVPQIIARADEVPAGCEDKNRYANVIPLPETRVILQQQNGDEKSEYINANYVRGPKDTTNYYIACQAPLETTVTDFWRMIWEQNSRVIIMATDLIENGIDKCAEYLPPSVTLDNHTVFGDYQVTLKHREVKEKYAISTLMLKNTVNDESREITHYWYQWPEAGVPTDEAAIIAMLLEARSSLKAYTIEQSESKIENSTGEDNNSSGKNEINGNVTSEKPKVSIKDQGPLTIHCSPGTGRTGTILACDIAMRCLEEPKRTVDIPQIVYSVRRGRASAVQTKEQYEFIYKVTHMYATKISNINNDN
ncbi:mucin-2 [Episyrphus balteatus]|uniref:mucin-2 n=1 Tax=Episyrphus balteatus TaxID=286459 RepID=UPI0024859BFD|nr:mucin-2 [Episyrphus balteatus]